MKPSKVKKWTRLDNAAKIFPSNSSERDTKVFRFSCELREEVSPEALQQALDLTMEVFPSFQVFLKHGLFWYYFESCDIRPLVREEHRTPCGLLYDPNRKSLLFEVTYFHKRINLEVYHALTDGTGALQFLKALAYHYLVTRHRDAFLDGPPPMDFDASLGERGDDSFQKYYSHKEKKGFSGVAPAYRISGPKLSENRIRVIEGVMPARVLLEKAREKNTTITVLLTSLLLSAIEKEMSVRSKKRPVVAQVPVNLRNFFPSGSVRNFFSVINVGFQFHEGWTFEELLASVGGSFERELTPEKMEARLNQLASLEHNLSLRLIPLPVKDIVLKIAHDLSSRECTCCLSNIGKVVMPEALCPYIRLFDVFISTDKLQICMCSFGDNLTASVTAPFLRTEIQKNFFRSISAMGVPVEIATNPLEEEWV